MRTDAVSLREAIERGTAWSVEVGWKGGGHWALHADTATEAAASGFAMVGERRRDALRGRPAEVRRILPASRIGCMVLDVDEAVRFPVTLGPVPALGVRP